MTERLDTERLNKHDIELLRSRVSLETHDINTLADHLEDYVQLQIDHKEKFEIDAHERHAIEQLSERLSGDQIYRLTRQQADDIKSFIADLQPLLNREHNF